MGHHHHHHHHHHQVPEDNQSVGRIRVAFILNLVFTIIELIGGIFTQSMSIIADAIHDLGDTFSLGLALILQKKASKAANSSYTYGYKRLSAASALITGMVLMVGTVIVLWESVPRIFDENLTPPDSVGMFVLALLGVAVNGFSAWKLSHGDSQNEKILSLHLLEDLLGWAAVLVGAIVIYFFKWPWVDPLLASLISTYILWHVVKGLGSTIKIFLQYIPEAVDLEKVKDNIEAIKGVSSLHDYHAWSLDGESHVFSCSIILGQDRSDESNIKSQIRSELKNIGFTHITIEILAEEEEGCH